MLAPNAGVVLLANTFFENDSLVFRVLIIVFSLGSVVALPLNSQHKPYIP